MRLCVAEWSRDHLGDCGSVILGEFNRLMEFNLQPF